jgi:hypothetical protein
LDHYPVLVQSEQLPTCARIKSGEEEREGRTVPGEFLVRVQVGRNTLCDELLDCLAHRQSIRLGKEIGHEFIVITHWLTRNLDTEGGVGMDMKLEIRERERRGERLYRGGVWALAEPDELCWRHSALMQQLVEGVLSVSTRLSKHDLPALVWQDESVQRDALAIALHINLDEKGGERRNKWGRAEINGM